MDHYTRGYRQDSDSDVMSFVASTPGVKRDGIEIDQTAWQLDNYEHNNVVLWAHDYWQLPIGTADVRLEGDQLLADITFDEADDFAQTVERKYRDGYLNAVSVGWRDVTVGEGDDEHTEHELLDISAVPVPGDPDALAERQRSALRDVASRMLETLEPTADEVESDWATVAAKMVGALTLADDEAERRARYDALLPAYRRLGKVAPEWLSDDELRALEKDDVWMYLEGEDTIDARGLAALEQAQELIRQVLDGMDDNESDPLQEIADIIGVVTDE